MQETLVWFLSLENPLEKDRLLTTVFLGFPCDSAGKESACNAGDPSSIPLLGRSTGEGIGYLLQYSWASLVAQLAKNLPAMQDTWVWSLGWEDSSWGRAWQPIPVFLPGESPWPVESGGLKSMGSQRVRHDWATKHKNIHQNEELKMHYKFKIQIFI